MGGMDRIDALFRNRSHAWAASITFGLLALLLAVYSDSIFGDGDTNWHVATGLWILDHHQIPATDPFSFTATGRKWVTHEWLSEVAMALSFKAFGWSGVRVLTGLAFAGACIVVAREVLRHLNLVPSVLLALICYKVLVPHVLARPHIVALPLMALCVVELLSARRESRTPGLWMLPMMTLWSNLHASYFIGLAFIGVFGLEAVLDAGVQRIRTGLSWAGFGAAALVCSLLTPNFIDGLIYPFYVMNMKDLAAIDEWKPASFAAITPLEVAILGTIFMLFYKKITTTAVRIILLLVLLHMTLQHERQEFVLILVGLLVLAEPLGRSLEPVHPATPLRTPDPAGATRGRALVAVTLAAMVITATARLVVREDRVSAESVPVAALDHVPANIRTLPVFNDYSFGGWLIFNHVRPFIDGRSDMYGDALFRTFLEAWSGDPDSISRTFKKYRIAWVIVPPSAAVVKWLDQRPDWRLVYRDKWAVTYVRTTPARP